MTEEKKYPYSAFDDFKAAVDLTKSLLKEGILSVQFVAPYRVRFRLDEQRLQTSQFAAKADDNYKKILYNEISATIRGLLAGKIDSGFPAPVEYRWKVEDFREKALYVDKELLTKDMRDCYAIKHTSKNLALVNIDWAISRKQHDMAKGSLRGIPFATVRLDFHVTPVVPVGTRWEIPFELFETKREVLTFDLHLLEIEQLIEDLTTIKHNLSYLKSEVNP